MLLFETGEKEEAPMAWKPPLRVPQQLNGSWCLIVTVGSSTGNGQSNPPLSTGIGDLS